MALTRLKPTLRILRDSTASISLSGPCKSDVLQNPAKSNCLLPRSARGVVFPVETGSDDGLGGYRHRRARGRSEHGTLEILPLNMGDTALIWGFPEMGVS